LLVPARYHVAFLRVETAVSRSASLRKNNATRERRGRANANETKGFSEMVMNEAEWKEVETPASGDLWDFDDRGDLIGIYKGSDTVQTRIGESLMHRLTTEEGEDVCLFGKAMLTRKLQGLEGHSVRIRKTGRMIPTRNGQAHEFVVWSK
jgi:hypothetical protein